MDREVFFKFGKRLEEVAVSETQSEGGKLRMGALVVSVQRSVVEVHARADNAAVDEREEVIGVSCTTDLNVLPVA